MRPALGGARVRVASSDLAAQYLGMKAEIDAAIEGVLLSGEFERSDQLWEFESEFAHACGVEHGVGVASGLAALLLALKGLGLGPGDQVITVPNTDISSCAAISHVGAEIVWADVEEGTHNLDPARVEALIGPRTRAIMAVSLYGLPADLPQLGEIARRHHLWLVSDAALAFGATVEGRPLGPLADVTCFSFAPTKVLGAYGDGGMVVTADEQLAARVRLLAGYGEPDRQSMADAEGRVRLRVEGYHLHLDVLQAAVLRAKLPRVPEWLRRRRELAALYDRLLARPEVIPQQVPPGFTHAYRSYVVRLPKRDSVRLRLEAAGIRTSLLYAPPLHLQEAYRRLGHGPGDYPVVERLSESLLCLPLYPEMADEAVEMVAAALNSALDGLN